MINATYVQNGKLVGKSQVAAGVGIFAVLTTRILNAWPDFVVGAAVMHAFEKRGIYVTKSPLAAGALLMSFFVTAFTPFCCAMFPQQLVLPVRVLEPSLGRGAGNAVQFNRGL